MSTPAGRRVLYALGALVTLACLALVLTLLDYEAAWRMLARLDPATLGLGVAVYGLSLVFRARRAALVIGEAGGGVFTARALLPVVLLHNFYNRILPFRTGEATYVLLLKRLNAQGYDLGLSSLFVTRLWDGALVILLLAISLVALAAQSAALMPIALAMFALSAAIIGALFLLPRLFSGTATCREATRHPLRARLHAGLWAVAAQMRAANRPGLSWRLALLSLGIWGCVFGANLLFLTGFGVLRFELASLFLAIAGSTFSLFVYMLPISLATGPMEASWTAGFVFFGVDRAEALASGFGVNLIIHAANILFILPVLIAYLAAARSARSRT